MNKISGSYLIANGWERKGSTYTKDGCVITYDGADWWMTKKIKYEIDVHDGKMISMSGKLNLNDIQP